MKTTGISRYVATGALCLGLAACASGASNTQIGGVTGAVLGAVAGSALTGSFTGTVVGAVLGGAAGYKIGKREQ